MMLPVIADAESQDAHPPTAQEPLHEVVIRFAGDSGDGMQLAGTQFTNTSALVGNDIATFPDFPAEIRAPAGTLRRRLRLPGPLRRQRHLHAGRRPRRPGGDEPGGAQDQPRATCKPAASLIVNTDAFDDGNLEKAGYETNPLEDGSLDELPRLQGRRSPS